MYSQKNLKNKLYMKSITKQQVAKFGSPGWTGVAVTTVGIWNSTLGLLELDGGRGTSAEHFSPS